MEKIFMKLNWFGLVMLFMSLYLMSQPQRADTIIAIVNEDVITYGELMSKAKEMLLSIENSGLPAERKEIEKQKALRNILENMVDEKLILQEAKRYNINISDKTVREKIEEELKDKGSDLDTGEVDISELMRSRLTLQELFQKKTTYSQDEKFRAVIDTFVSPMEIRHYYEKNLKKKYTREYKIKTRLITLYYKKHNGKDETILLANNIVQQLKTGADFGEMAKKYSDDRYAQDGGTWPRIAVEKTSDQDTENQQATEKKQATDTKEAEPQNTDEVWDFFGKSKGQDDALLKEVEVVAFALPQGGYSSPIPLESDIACQIVKIEAVQQGGLVSFLDVQDEIRQELRSKKVMSALSRMRDRLRACAFLWFAKN